MSIFEQARRGKLLGDKESLNHTCSSAWGNTPIMWAVEKVDADSVRLLAKAGAKIKIKNWDGETAEEIAMRVGRREDEGDEGQSGEAHGRQSGEAHGQQPGEASAGNPAKAITSNPAKPTADNPAEPTADDPAEPTADEFVQQVDDYVKSTPTLSIFFKDDNRFMQNMAAKLVDLAKDTTTDLASPQVLPMTIEVTMHQQVIYCDDSSSMTNRKGTAEKRWENQKELALRIAKIGTLILPDDQGVALRFINQRTADESANLDLEALGRGFESVSPRGDTPIGTTLRERILEPLVLQPLAEGRFKRPLLVSILTDGGPSREDPGKLARVILECGNELVKNGYPMDSVKFLVGQIGSSKEAVDFLDTLRGNSDIDKVTYVFAGRFDDKFKSFRDQRALDRWLVTTLYQPLANAARRNA
ncbi:hypothetical protein RB594_000674 [Gaeumannomyces avenae]